MPLQNTHVAVQTTATLLTAANTRRTGLIITNNGPNPIHVGAAGITAGDGVKIPAGAVQELGPAALGDGVKEAFYALADTANQVAPADTHILEAIG